MQTSRPSRRRSARANLMVAMGSALYFSVLLLALYVMDRQVYSAAKLEIIRDNFLEIFHPPDALNEQARSALFSPSKIVRERELKKLRENLEDIVHGPTSMYRMSLVDESGKTLVEVADLDKPTRMNTWTNNLFIRSFSGRTSQNVSPYKTSAETSATRTGHVTGIYTSPTGVKDIEKLTASYRIYAGALVVAWIFFWLLIYYYLLRPVRNVTLYLDKSRGGAPSMIPYAWGALEQGYNALAASALLQMIEEKLNAAARPDPSGGVGRRHDAVRAALALAGNGFGAAHLRVGLVGKAEASGDSGEYYQWSAATAPAMGAGNELAFPPLTCPVNQDSTHVVAYPDNSGFTYYAPLADGCLQADCIYRDTGTARDFQENLVRTCDVLRAGFVSFQAYREQLFRERSEANISLSRNMGHDLTNIIATSKLELMGIKRMLDSATVNGPLPAGRATILADSVKGLLESTRLMQEMVNIYRSFSYVKRPAYERRSLQNLIEEFLVTFQPALSSQMHIEARFADDLPSPIIEPRLLKLALFNVLQNATDAIKRSPDIKERLGKIVVSVSHHKQDDRFEVTVTDNGPGIRDEAGGLLSHADAQIIFEYGYTTKGEGGEGLGLNWVRTIMTDYHDGGARAENLPEGGTALILWLRSMERKEARVADNPTAPRSLP